MGITTSPWWILLMFFLSAANAFYAGYGLARQKKWKFSALVAAITFVLAVMDLFDAVSS